MDAGTPAHGVGLPYMMGPTGGYLLGYVPAAFAVGFFAERGAARSVPQLLGAMTLGHVVLFATGYGLQGLEERYRGRPVLQKPFRSEELRLAIEAVAA